MKTPRLNLKNTAVWRYLFKRDTLLATIAVLLVIGIFTKIETTLGILDPKEMTSKDFDYNDLAFNLLNKFKNIPTDTSICIVAIGDADRAGIANIINKISLAKPKVIGIDILFDKPKPNDSLLNQCFGSNTSIVAAYQLDSANHHTNNCFISSNRIKSGYVNFTLEDQSIIRGFMPAIGEGDTTLSFSAAILKAAAPDKYTTLRQRGHEFETINYTRNENKFIIINGNSPLTDFAILKNKIVLLGSVSTGNNYEDKHFTPLNSVFTGKSMPDLNGITIHANIIQMMLDGTYINKSSAWFNWAVAFILCWLHMAFFIAYFIEKHIWFHLAAKVVQLISAIFFVYVGLFVFYTFNRQINMTDAIVAIVLAVDVLYFYEAGVLWLHQKRGFKTVFHHEHTH